MNALQADWDDETITEWLRENPSYKIYIEHMPDANVFVIRLVLMPGVTERFMGKDVANAKYELAETIRRGRDAKS